MTDLVSLGVAAMQELAATDTAKTPKTDADYVQAILDAVSQLAFDLGSLS